MADHLRNAPRPDFLGKPTLTEERVLLRPATVDDVPALPPMFRDAGTLAAASASASCPAPVEASEWTRRSCRSWHRNGSATVADRSHQHPGVREPRPPGRAVHQGHP
ncbi:hypothetical protein ACWDPC_30400, partial [Streptomyces misionensis]